MEPIASLHLHATLNDLKMIREFVERELDVCGIDPDGLYDLVYSMNEITTNILVHGYGPQKNESGPIEVEIHRTGQTVRIIIRDKAPVFDPKDAPIPNIHLPLETRKPGGLGVFLVREFTDQLLHRPLEGGGNEVTLVKEIERKTQ